MTDLNAPPLRRPATVPPPTPARVQRPVNKPMTMDAADTKDGRQPTARPRPGQPSAAANRRGPSTGSTGSTGSAGATGAAGSGGSAGSAGSGGTVQLDGIAKLIIEQLQQDGRRSYAAIGKAVGLSEAAVRQRVQKLLETGVMQIVAVTDPMMLGFQRQVMIAIKCEGDPVGVADHLAEMEEIDYIVVTAGSFDILVELVCESDEQLLELLGRVRSVPTVTSTETFVYLKLRKQTYSWGTR
jgi:Lrp/AsnC family transcriptional regulator for asnA, asnC and gidA